MRYIASTGLLGTLRPRSTGYSSVLVVIPSSRISFTAVANSRSSCSEGTPSWLSLSLNCVKSQSSLVPRGKSNVSRSNRGSSPGPKYPLSPMV